MNTTSFTIGVIRNLLLFSTKIDLYIYTVLYVHFVEHIIIAIHWRWKYIQINRQGVKKVWRYQCGNERPLMDRHYYGKNRTKEQTKIYKTFHRKLQIEQHKPTINWGRNYIHLIYFTCVEMNPPLPFLCLPSHSKTW